MLVETEYNFPAALKSIRESRGMTQRELGEAMGINFNRISNWELGYNAPTLPVFRLLSLALNCPPGDLLGLSSSALTGAEYNLLKGFRDLDVHDREAVLTMVETLLRRHQ